MICNLIIEIGKKQKLILNHYIIESNIDNKF